MFAASRVANTTPGGSAREATKKSPALRTRRASHAPATTISSA